MSNLISHDQLISLVAALMRLREETLAKVFQATGIRGANLSVWLKGKPQVISDRRVATLLDYLGVRQGRLRADVLHRWAIAESVGDLKTVLEMVVTGGDREHLVIYRDMNRDPEAIAALEVPNTPIPTFVLLSAAPTLSGPPRISADDIGFGNDVESPIWLRVLPTKSPGEFANAISAMRPESIAPTYLSESEIASAVAGIASAASEAAQNLGRVRNGPLPNLAALQAEIIAAIKEGISPDELARLIARIRVEAKKPRN
jgi:hypothetical protein